MDRVVTVLFAVLFVAACPTDGTTDSGECSGNSECRPGEICVEGRCEQVCDVDTACSAGEICEGSLCVPGTRDEPRIDSIDGDGPEDGVVGHSQHHLLSHLIVSGANLEGAEVTLVSATDTLRLEVCEQQPDRLSVKFPDDLAPGDYHLAVVNQSGSCESTLPVLQGIQGPPGEQGPAGPLPTVALGSGLVGDGSAGAALAVDFGSNGLATTVARSDHTHPLADGTIEPRHMKDLGLVTDLARHAPVTVTAGTLHGAGPVSEFGTADAWTTNTFPSSMTVDLGALRYSIGEITFDSYWRGDGRFLPEYEGPGAYVLEHSEDNATWTAIPCVSPSVNGTTSVHTFPRVNARYVRLTVNAPRTPGNSVHISMFRVVSGTYGDSTLISGRRIAGQTCVFQKQCRGGLVDRGTAGFIMGNADGCPYSAGGAYNSGWSWCHPRLCCNF